MYLEILNIDIMRYIERSFNISLRSIEPPFKILSLGFNILRPRYIKPPTVFIAIGKPGDSKYYVCVILNTLPILKSLWRGGSDYAKYWGSIFCSHNLNPLLIFNARGGSKYYGLTILNPPGDLDITVILF